MKKRIGLSLLSLLVCIWAMASETSVKNDAGVEIWYNFDSSTNTASVTYKGSDYSSEGYTGEVVIPSKVTYEGVEYSVTSIGERAFYYCYGLTDVTIPNSVTSIGNNAFRNCSGLTNVTIPNSVTSIGRQAFSRCSGLTNVTIPNSVTSIGDEAFYGCSGLTNVTIPNSVTSIGTGAFYNCDGLTNVTIPNSVTSIGASAFFGCSGLTSITVPNGVMSIGDDAFQDCNKLYEVYNKSDLTITVGSKGNGYVAYYAKNVYTDSEGESKLKTVGDYVFYVDGDNIELLSYTGDETSITLPAEYEGKSYKIADYAFYSCDGLTSVTIPESVTSIGERAFYSCSGLTNVTIPNSVTSIGDGVFYSCI